MNILLINHYAGSGYHGMEYRPFYLAREWVKLGHKVTIIAASFSHLHNQRPVIKGNLTMENIEGINYIWLKTPSYQGNGAQRVINMFTFGWRLYVYSQKIINACCPDIVIASSPHPFMIYGAQKIVNKAKAKLIFEVRDLWPLTLIELGGVSPRHPFIRMMQWTEDYAYNKAHKVVSLLPKASAYMQEHGMTEEKFRYIPNGISVEEWEIEGTSLPEEHEKVIQELKSNGNFLIGYAGTHGIANALEYLIASAELLKNQSVVFILVGQGSEKEKLQQRIKEQGLKNVVFLPGVKKTAIPKLLARMDALYIGWKREALYRFGVSPNKLMDYMMAGKPVIHSIEAGNDMVAESGCGISVPPENSSAVADAIIKMMNTPKDELTSMGLKGQEYVLQNHDYRILARRFLEDI